MSEPNKYLIVETYDCECVVVFNSILDHSKVATGMKVIAAGFCWLPDELNDQVFAWGKSTILKIESRGIIDAKLILRNLCPHLTKQKENHE